MYYQKSPNYIPKVKEIQRMLNLARYKAYQLIEADRQHMNIMMDKYYFQKIHHQDRVPENWQTIMENGCFDLDTERAVKAFQRFLFISETGIVGDTTYAYLQQLMSFSPSQPNSNIERRAYNITRKSYNIIRKSSGGLYQIDSIVGSKEKGLMLIFSKWEKMLDEQSDGLLRRIQKFPAKGQMRVRNITKQMEACKKFLDRASKYGINLGITDFSAITTKEAAINAIKDLSALIKASPVYKTVQTASAFLNRLNTIIKPFVRILNSIPGLKYLSAIDKIYRGYVCLFTGGYEESLSLFLDGLRELLEQIVIDSAVLALVALGGWIALVLAVILILGAMIIDYFFFSSNPGDTLADKYTGMNTHNYMQESIAPSLYHTIYD